MGIWVSHFDYKSSCFEIGFENILVGWVSFSTHLNTSDYINITARVCPNSWKVGILEVRTTLTLNFSMKGDVYKNRLTLLYMACQEPIDYGTTLIKLMVNWLLAIINGNESVDLQWHFSHMGTYTGHCLAQQQPDKSDTKVILRHRYSTLGYVCVISSFHDEMIIM